MPPPLPPAAQEGEHTGPEKYEIFVERTGEGAFNQGPTRNTCSPTPMGAMPVDDPDFPLIRTLAELVKLFTLVLCGDGLPLDAASLINLQRQAVKSAAADVSEAAASRPERAQLE